MKKFSHRFRVGTSIEEVARFHGDTRILRILTPPPIIVQFHKVEPLSEGSRAEFTLWAGPIPIRWAAVHSNVDPLTGFTDTQINGPFKSWVHNRNFRIIDPQTTEINDEVSAEPGNHFFWGLISRLLWWSLPLLFTYRQWRTKRALENH